MMALAAPLLNLGESDARLLREREWRCGQLSELAYAIAQVLDGERPASAREYFALAEPLLREQALSSLTPEDRVALTRFLLREAEARFGSSVPCALLGGPFSLPERCRVALVANPPLEEAYRRFAPALASPTVLYHDSLRALCDDVETGYADYAVLPLCTERGPVAPVWGMIEERSLVVVSTVRIATEEDLLEIALVGREPTATAPTSLAVRFTADSTAEIAAFLSVAAALGLRLRSSEVTPARFGDGALSCRAVLVGAEQAAFITYLSLFTKAFTVLGLYTEL